MINKLPINIDDLLRQRAVEGERIEYKAGWNPDAVVRTLCAFANDFENLGGGYVVIGQDCDGDGRPIFPPAGLDANRLDSIQRELLAFCNQIQPAYFPILSVERYEGRSLIVLWAPGGMNRPYKAPRAVTAKTKEYRYFIRRYSSTIEVNSNGEDERELLRLTANIPFDDRRCVSADVDDLRPGIVLAYLKEIGSNLHEDAAGMPLVELGRRMNIIDGSDEFVKPRNVGVLFFHDEPRRFLPGAQIDVVIFPDGPGGDVIIEKSFHGPLHEQVRDALRYIESNAIRRKIVKRGDRAKADRLLNYSFPAVEESLVNAVYHRGYDQQEPVEVRIDPDGIEIVSYPGPDASIRIEALQGEKIVARRYRNRRIGEFLKELDLTEGRSTGIPKIRGAMATNGSPSPLFSTDEGRTYFLVELPVHPELAGVRAHDEAHGEAHQELTEAEARILWFVSDRPRSRTEIAQYLGQKSRSGHLYRSIDRLRVLGFVELTIPEKPRSRNQKLRLAEEGAAWLAAR